MTRTPPGRTLSVWQFFKIRTIRLYPLYLIGLISAVVVLITSYYAEGQIIGGHVMDWTALPYAVFALPSPFAREPHNFVYPLNFPAWSLFFEFTINILYALTWRLWSVRVLPVVILTSGVLLLLFGGDGDNGWSWAGFPIGMLRCCYAFPFGVLIYKLHTSGYRAPRIPGQLCLAAFSFLLLTPSSYVIPVCVLAGAPLIATFAASAQTGATFGRLFSQLGLMSYALYAIHIPLMNATRAVLFGLHANPDTYVAGFAFLAVISPICILLDRYYDVPVRQRLTKTLLSQARAPALVRVGPPQTCHAVS